MHSLKGVSLLVGAIIVITLCIIVLVVVSLFFTGTFNPTSSEIISESDLLEECADWQKYDYDYSYFDKSKYPKLAEKFGGPLTAKLYCVGVPTEVRLVEETSDPEGVCGTKPLPVPPTNYVCCCIEGTKECSWYEGSACP